MPGAVSLDVITGPGQSIDLGLVAAAASEGPQVLLTWNRLDVGYSRFIIVQRLDHRKFDLGLQVDNFQ